MGGQAALASASNGSHLGASARARACPRTAAWRRFPAQAVAAIQCPGGRRGGAGFCAGQQELKASVLTAAASLEAVRAALREPRRTLTELGDGGRQGEQSLTPAGAPAAPDRCHRLSNRPGDHELESVAFHVEQRCREGRLSANAEPKRRRFAVLKDKLDVRFAPHDRIAHLPSASVPTRRAGCRAGHGGWALAGSAASRWASL